MVLKITLLDYSSWFCPSEAGSMRQLVGLPGCSTAFVFYQEQCLVAYCLLFPVQLPAKTITCLLEGQAQEISQFST